jgi:hypothetical protein
MQTAIKDIFREITGLNNYKNMGKWQNSSEIKIPEVITKTI